MAVFCTAYTGAVMPVSVIRQIGVWRVSAWWQNCIMAAVIRGIQLRWWALPVPSMYSVKHTKTSQSYRPCEPDLCQCSSSQMHMLSGPGCHTASCYSNTPVTGNLCGSQCSLLTVALSHPNPGRPWQTLGRPKGGAVSANSVMIEQRNSSYTRVTQEHQVNHPFFVVWTIDLLSKYLSSLAHIGSPCDRSFLAPIDCYYHQFIESLIDWHCRSS